MRGLGIIGTKWRRAKVAVIEVRVRIPRSLGRPATCLESAPFPGVSSAEFPPHRLVPGSVGGPFLERLNSYLPPPSSTPAFLFCLSHFLPQPLPPRCVEEDNQVRTNVAPAFPRKRKKGESVSGSPGKVTGRYKGWTGVSGGGQADGRSGAAGGELGPGGAEARGGCNWNWAETRRGGPVGAPPRPRFSRRLPHRLT